MPSAQYLVFTAQLCLDASHNFGNFQPCQLLQSNPMHVDIFSDISTANVTRGLLQKCTVQVGSVLGPQLGGLSGCNTITVVRGRNLIN